MTILSSLSFTMPLFETLAIGIGTSVAVAALKLWLGDEELLLSPAKSAIDIFGKRFLEEREKRKAKRTLESLSDRCADSFKALLDKEANRLTDTEFEIVANAASTTISSTPFSQELLASHNLDPIRLQQYYLALSGGEGGNPGLAKHQRTELKDLYERLIFHASQQIIALASELPRHNDAVFSELLLRDERLLAIGDQVLGRLDHLIAQQSGLDPYAERFETNYRYACDTEFGRLSLFGVDLQPSTRRYSLSVAYITLDVEASRSPLDNKAATANHPEAPNQHSISAHDALASTNRLLIRGSAGSGKTTFVQWVTVNCAGKRHKGQLEFANSLVPFVVRLREFSDRDLPSPDDFPHLVSSALPKPPAGWCDRILSSGSGIVLVDGLDEAPDDKREDVRKWLHQLTHQYSRCRFIVTTRPHAIEEGWLDADGFFDTTLKDLSTRDVETFITHWHDAVASDISDEPQKSSVQQGSKDLVSTIRLNFNLARLATNPLLCAMICALHRDRVKRLPNDRLELYEECIKMFFRRDDERNIDARSYITLSTSQKQQVLQSFAYWLLRNNLTSTSTDKATATLHRASRSLQNLDISVNGTSILKLLVERVGLLREFARGKVDFPHRTFQEYFAANEIISSQDTDFLTGCANEENWREVASMAPGLAKSPKDAEHIIRGYLTKGDQNPDERQALYLIAASALDSVSRLPDESSLKQLVTDRIESIVPPSTMRDAKSLANAGPLVVPLLRYASTMGADQAAAAARTLALINTPEAFDTLKEYATDTRVTVLRELATSDSYLTCVEAQKTRAAMCEMHSRSFSMVRPSTPAVWRDCALIEDFKPLAHLTALHSLTLRRSPWLSRLEGLGHNETLERLDVSESPRIRDASAVRRFPNLRYLNLRGCIISTGLEAVASLPALEEAIISLGFPEPNIQDLRKSKSLNRLDLSYCDMMTDLSDLSGIHSLSSLALVHCPNIARLDGIEAIPKLKELTVVGAEDLTELGQPGSHPLEELSIYDCSERIDVAGLLSFPQLRSLDLTWDHARDLRELPEIPALARLSIFDGGSFDRRKRQEIAFLCDRSPNLVVRYNSRVFQGPVSDDEPLDDSPF